MTQTTIDKMKSQANALFTLGCVSRAENGFDVRSADSSRIDSMVFHVEANQNGDLSCACASHDSKCFKFEDEGVCAHIFAAEMLAAKILDDADLENAPTDKMICITERRGEFVPALERGASSNLTVYAYFEPDTFVVESGGEKEYHVTLETRDEKLFGACECADFEFRKRVCKHLGEVLVFNCFRSFAGK
jgi:hypothetical protein